MYVSGLLVDVLTVEDMAECSSTECVVDVEADADIA